MLCLDTTALWKRLSGYPARFSEVERRKSLRPSFSR